MIGGMFRLAAIQAAVLDVKLKYLNGWHEARRHNAAIYNKASPAARSSSPTVAKGNHSIYNQYVVRVPNRDAVNTNSPSVASAHAVYYPIPLHMQECFGTSAAQGRRLPGKRTRLPEVLALPVYPELTTSRSSTSRRRCWRSSDDPTPVGSACRTIVPDVEQFAIGPTNRCSRACSRQFPRHVRRLLVR
jgi:dTDP-4-amino-4,6-dideoxygalactose transaminase